MNNSKIKILIVLLLVLLTQLLVACSQTSEQVETADPPTPFVDGAIETTDPPDPQATSAEISATTMPAVEGLKFPVNTNELKGLLFDEFLDQSYGMLLQRDPELVTELGLMDLFGTGNYRLTDISDRYVRETHDLERALLEELRAFDRSSLNPDQQLSYDIYEWYLDDLVRQHEFMYNDYPVTHFLTGVQNQLIYFFADIHPIRNRQEADDYITRLSQVDEKFDQLLEGLVLREQAGVILPAHLIPWVTSGMNDIARSSPRFTPFYGTFERKLSELDNINAEDKAALLSMAEEEIKASVIPAFNEIVDYLNKQSSLATMDDGVWKFPNGSDYYEYILRHHSTTEMGANEIHEIGKKELSRIQSEMRVIFDELGYPTDESLQQLFSRVTKDGGSVSGSEIVATYEDIIEDADRKLDDVFDLKPQADVIVIGGPTGGFYVQPAIDGSRPGAFYAAVNGTEPKFGMPSLTYHEAIPGHHYQIAIAQELDLPMFRRGSLFTGYAEGWALYAERLAWEMGLYEGDPYGNLGRLQMEAFRAARLIVDTGIHAQGWTVDQAVDYMVENTGLATGFMEFEVRRYITWPGQATAYMLGMLKILELRQMAMDQLGDQFDIKEFHNVVIGSGSLPLEVLERVVKDYITAKLA